MTGKIVCLQHRRSEEVGRDVVVGDTWNPQDSEELRASTSLDRAGSSGKGRVV